MKTNNLSAVYKHMNKEQTEEQIQLATHKVEFASLMDMVESIEKAYLRNATKAKSERQEIVTNLRKVIKLGGGLIDVQRSLKDDEKDLANVLSNIARSANDLGVDPMTIKQYERGRNMILPDILALIDELREIFAVLNQIHKVVSKL